MDAGLGKAKSAGRVAEPSGLDHGRQGAQLGFGDQTVQGGRGPRFALERLQLGFGGFQTVEGGLEAGAEQAPFFGRRHPSGRALKKPSIQILFQRRQSGRHSGLGQAGRFGGLQTASGFEYRKRCMKAAKLEI